MHLVCIRNLVTQPTSDRILASIRSKSMCVPRLQVLPSFCRSQRTSIVEVSLLRRTHAATGWRGHSGSELVFESDGEAREGCLALIRGPYSKRPSFPVDGHRRLRDCRFDSRFSKTRWQWRAGRLANIYARALNEREINESLLPLSSPFSFGGSVRICPGSRKNSGNRTRRDCPFVSFFRHLACLSNVAGVFLSVRDDLPLDARHRKFGMCESWRFFALYVLLFYEFAGLITPIYTVNSFFNYSIISHHCSYPICRHCN